MQYNVLILDSAEHVATIRLNRLEKHNAINCQMSAELIACLDKLEADDDIRVIVLTGAGEKAFCAGADMAEAVAGPIDGRATNDSAARAALRLLLGPKTSDRRRERLRLWWRRGARDQLRHPHLLRPARASASSARATGS